MPQQFTNQAKAALTGSIGTGATALAVTGGLADLFPVANTSNWGSPVNWFKALITDNLGNIEVIKVGVRASGSGALSNILRAQDGTTAKAFTAGAAWVVHGPLASDFQDVLAGNFPSLSIAGAAAAASLAASGNATVGGSATVAGNLSVAGTITANDITQDGIAGRITPVGGIIMWSGAVAAIPTGWALCNGTNGTPDLRDKFVIAAGTDLAGASQTNITGAQSKSGGTKDAVVVAHAHTTTEAPHTHGISPTAIYTAGTGGVGTGAGGSNPVTIDPATTGLTVNSTGVSGTNQNLPPYYALAFIMALATP